MPSETEIKTKTFLGKMHEIKIFKILHRLIPVAERDLISLWECNVIIGDGLNSHPSVIEVQFTSGTGSVVRLQVT